jgi:hypothetical protein
MPLIRGQDERRSMTRLMKKPNEEAKKRNCPRR